MDNELADAGHDYRPMRRITPGDFGHPAGDVQSRPGIRSKTGADVIQSLSANVMALTSELAESVAGKTIAYDVTVHER